MPTISFIVCHYNIYKTYAGVEEQMKPCNKHTAESNQMIAISVFCILIIQYATVLYKIRDL